MHALLLKKDEQIVRPDAPHVYVADVGNDDGVLVITSDKPVSEAEVTEFLKAEGIEIYYEDGINLDEFDSLDIDI